MSRSISRQYGSVIFYHDGEQRRLAETAKEQRQTSSGQQTATEIIPYSEFWRAEDYHQKYALRGTKDLMAEFEAIYPEAAEFVDSTAAARVNGYVGGHGTIARLEAEIEILGLSAEGRRILEELALPRLRR